MQMTFSEVISGLTQIREHPYVSDPRLQRLPKDSRTEEDQCLINEGIEIINQFITKCTPDQEVNRFEINRIREEVDKMMAMTRSIGPDELLELEKVWDDLSPYTKSTMAMRMAAVIKPNIAIPKGEQWDRFAHTVIPVLIPE